MRAHSLKTIVAEEEEYKNLTYAMKEERIAGYVDGIEAVKQAVYKILNTQRFEYPIYSFYYGTELNKLTGKEQPYVRAELKRIVTESLLQDDRIQDVSEFEFLFSGDMCMAEFTVKSIYGNVPGKVEVTI